MNYVGIDIHKRYSVLAAQRLGSGWRAGDLILCCEPASISVSSCGLSLGFDPKHTVRQIRATLE
jgi:hypothetical protein